MLPVVTIEKSPTKSFLTQITEQIDLKLLKNPAFTLFVISNFLTSLGFNVIYNYADDLANDSKVVKDYRTYIVMSIGLSNILGRLIIGYLGDRKWVRQCCAMKTLYSDKIHFYLVGESCPLIHCNIDCLRRCYHSSAVMRILCNSSYRLCILFRLLFWRICCFDTHCSCRHSRY